MSSPEEKAYRQLSPKTVLNQKSASIAPTVDPSDSGAYDPEGFAEYLRQEIPLGNLSTRAANHIRSLFARVRDLPPLPMGAALAFAKHIHPRSSGSFLAISWGYWPLGSGQLALGAIVNLLLRPGDQPGDAPLSFLSNDPIYIRDMHKVVALTDSLKLKTSGNTPIARTYFSVDGEIWIFVFNKSSEGGILLFGQRLSFEELDKIFSHEKASIKGLLTAEFGYSEAEAAAAEPEILRMIEAQRYKTLLASRPKAAPLLYSNRPDRKQNIVEFLQSTYGHWLQDGVIDRPYLLRVDKSAYNALSQWLHKKLPLPAGFRVPTQAAVNDILLETVPLDELVRLGSAAARRLKQSPPEPL